MREEALKLLKKLEWNGEFKYFHPQGLELKAGSASCPSCGGYKYNSPENNIIEKGHKENCELKYLIAEREK